MDRRNWLLGCVAWIFGIAVSSGDAMAFEAELSRVQNDSDLEPAVCTYAGFVAICPGGAIQSVSFDGEVTRVTRSPRPHIPVR